MVEHDLEGVEGGGQSAVGDRSPDPNCISDDVCCCMIIDEAKLELQAFSNTVYQRFNVDFRTNTSNQSKDGIAQKPVQGTATLSCGNVGTLQ